MRSAPVTTDLRVLQGWPKDRKKRPDVCCRAADIAAALSLTVFQITARLKGMEQRGFVERDPTGSWSMTEVGRAEALSPSPSMLLASKPRVPSRTLIVGAAPRPDDSRVPHTSGAPVEAGWRVRLDRATSARIITAPDGREYASARPFEAADLIVDYPRDGWDYSMFPAIRLRLLATSNLQKRARRAHRTETARAERTAAKRSAPARRHK